jgi:hypothetical protein
VKKEMCIRRKGVEEGNLCGRGKGVEERKV